MKKNISLLLVVLMIITMLPMGVAASGTLAAPTVSDSNGTVLSDGAAISTVEGELTLTFAEGLTIAQSTLGGITIAATDTGAFEGVVVPTADANKVKLKFGRLGVGAYKLTVPATVGTESDTLESAFEFAFSAEKKALVDTDFSGYNTTEGSNAVVNGTDNIYYTNSWSNTAASSITAVKSGDDTYVRTGMTAAAGGVAVIGNENLNSTKYIGDDKVYIVKADINSTLSGTLFGSAFTTLTNGSWDNKRTYSLFNIMTDSGALKGLSVLQETGVTKPADTKEATQINGWYRPMMVMRRGADEKVYSDLYYRDATDVPEFIGTDAYAIPANTEVKAIGLGVGYFTSTGNIDMTYAAAYPERLLSVLSVGSYVGNAETGSVTINMTDDVLDSSLSGITVTRGETAIENVVASKATDGRGIVLTFAGGLPAADYSVSLAGVKSSNGLNIYSESTTAVFNVDDDNANVSRYEPVPAISGDTIDTLAGEINLEFGVNIDPATIGGITFKKEDGTKIDGEYFVEAENNIVTVRFGNLTDGQKYVLDVPSTVMSSEESPKSVKAASFTYTAKAEYLTRVDFSEAAYNAENPTFTNGTDNLMYLDGAWTTVGTTTATVKSVGDNPYMQIINATKGGQYGIFLDATKASGKLKDDNFNDTSVVGVDRVFVIDADVSGTAAGALAYIGAKAISSGAGISPAVLSGSNADIYNTTVAALNTEGKVLSTLTGVNGNAAALGSELTKTGDWYKTRLVLRREISGANSGMLATDLYNYVTDNYAFIGTDDAYISASTSVNQIGIMGSYLGQNSTLNYDYIYARPERLMSVLGDNGYSGEAKSVTLYMTKGVKSDTASNIVVKKDGAAVSVADVTVGADGRSITVNFGANGLAAGSYAVDISGLVDSDGIKAYGGATYSFNVSEDEETKVMETPSVKDAKGNTLASGTEQAPAEISVLDGKVTLSFKNSIANPEAITFTKADGGAIKGKYIPDASGNDVNILFGHLDADSVYKITVPLTVKDADDRPLAEPFEFYLKAIEKYATKVDFNAEEGYTVGNAPTQGQNNLQYMAGWAEDMTGVTIKSEDGESYVNIANSTSAAHGVLLKADGTLANGFYDKELVNEKQAYVVEAKIRDSASNSTTRSFGIGTDADVNGKPTTPGTTYGAIVQYSSAGANGLGISEDLAIAGDPAITVDTTSKWIQPMLVIRQSTQDTEKIERELYDGLADYAYKGKVIRSNCFPTIKRNEWNDRIAINYWYGDAGTGNDIAYVYARPETLLSVLYAEEYKNGQPFKLYMTDDVDAATVGNIKLTTGGVEVKNITAAVDQSDARTIIITAPYGLTAGDYSVDVSAIISSRSKLLGSNSTYTFSVSEDEATSILSLDGITAPEGNIDVDAEKIELTFGASLAADAVNGVDFTKADGNPIKGIVDKKVDGNKIILSFGRLEDKADYKLEIKENAVKSADGNYTAAADSIDYTAVEKYEVYQDFTSATLPSGTSPYGNDTATSWGGENIKVEISGNAEIKTENGDSYLEIWRETQARYGVYLRPVSGSYFNDIFFTNNTDGKVLAIDIKLKEKRSDVNSDFAFAEPLLSVFSTEYNDTNPIWDPLMLSGEATVSAKTNAGMLEKYPQSSGYTMEKDNSGYIHASAVLKAGEDKYLNCPEGIKSINVDMSIFDVVAGKDLGTNICKNDLEGNDWDVSNDGETKNTITYNKIDWIRLAGRFANTENNRLQITEFSVIHANAMDILKSSGYNNASRTISVAMSDDVSEASLENIKVTNKETEEEVLLDATYDAQTRTVTVSFPWGIALGDYTLDVNGLSSARGFNDGKMESISFTVEEVGTYLTKPVFKCGEKTIVTEVVNAETELLLSAATSVSVTATVVNKPETMVAFIGVFDADGNLVTAKQAEISTDGVISATTSEFTAGKANSVKLFIWEDMENIKPLFATVCL